MEDYQKIKNRLGTIYLSLIILIAVLAFLNNWITITDIIDILLVLTLFILLQKNIIKLKLLCILSIIIGIIVLLTCRGLSIFMSLWLIIYSIISLTKIKKDVDI
jgi:hypothetical protein